MPWIDACLIEDIKTEVKSDTEYYIAKLFENQN